MTTTAFAIDVEELISEIGRYLAAVDAFRAAGCAPRWASEPVADHSVEPERSS